MPMPLLQPPVAPVREHTVSSPHGERLDPYYWLRDDERTNPEVLAYLTAENAYHAQHLAPVKQLEDQIYNEIVARLKGEGVRAELDESDERMQKKIRNAQKQKIPFMLLAGDDDVAADAVSFRYRTGAQNNGVLIDEAIAEIVTAVETRAQV